MTTLGYAPGIEPIAVPTKLMYMMQFGVSLAFLVLVFAVVVDQLASRDARSS